MLLINLFRAKIQVDTWASSTNVTNRRITSLTRLGGKSATTSCSIAGNYPPLSPFLEKVFKRHSPASHDSYTTAMPTSLPAGAAISLLFFFLKPLKLSFRPSPLLLQCVWVLNLGRKADFVSSHIKTRNVLISTSLLLLLF